MEYMELKVGSNVKGQLEADLQLETNAVAMYNKAVKIARENGDDQSRELFSKLLKDEEEHVDWLEAQLHQIKEMGYERYLSNQAEGGNEQPEAVRPPSYRGRFDRDVDVAADGVRDRATLLGAGRELAQLGLVDPLETLDGRVEM